MKTLKTLGLFLMIAFGALAQPGPNDMFIDGYVVDENGFAAENHEVCVAYLSNNPSLPSDTLCTTTNANGYYTLTVVNGSLTGPNIEYEIFTYDSCSFLPLVQTRQNYQGTIDTANVNFTLCASGGCDVSFTSSNDSINGTWTFVANPTGTAPFTYSWWVDGTSYSTQTVSHMFNGGTVGVYVTVTDADSCVSMFGDTLYLDGNQIGCSTNLIVLEDSLNNVLNAELTAIAAGVAPFTYSWSTGETTESIYLEDIIGLDSICVEITDANGCSSTACDVVGYVPTQSCSVEITTTVDSTLNGVFYALTASSGFVTYDWVSNNQLGQSITVQNPNPNGEVYCVVATDANGCTATACDTLFPINNLNCNADFITSANPNSVIEAGDTLAVTYTGSQSQYNYYFYTVQGNGMFMNSYDENPMFVLPSAGTYEVCLTVTDSITSCASSHCETVVVQGGTPTGCQAYFTWYEDSLLGNPQPAVAFNDGSQNAAYWFWDFGDNTTSTDQNPLHVYNAAGTYGVCLTIVNADQSCQQTYCDTVVVGNSGGGNCSAAFSNSGPTPIGYTFTANVQSNDLYYQWSIDNQNLSGNGYEILAPGLTNGVHTICLTVIDSLNNCADTQCQTITVGNNNCYGYISGQVYAGSNNQPLDVGVVYLITYDSNTNQLTAVDSMVVDSGNYYFFGPLDCGDYMIKAAAYAGSQYYSDHVPTYFGNSPFWGFAQTIELAQANAQVSADVFLISANNPGGPGFIGGDVTQGANKFDPGDPVEGMQVMLFDLNGNAINYVYTDANGEFAFPDLAYGSYQVYVEQLGVDTDPAYVTIGPDNPSVEDLNIYASETLISTGINEFDFEGAISQVYPNPVAEEASVNFSLETEVMVNVSILDLTGRMVSTEVQSVSSGEDQVRIDVGGLKQGYYFLNIQDEHGTFSVTRKFMRVD